MIRCVMHAATGPIVFLGIVEENIRRLKDGRPIEVDLGEMLVEATKGEDLTAEAARGTQRIRLFLAYGHTHLEIMREIEESTKIRLPSDQIDAARRLDEQLRAEGLLP